MPSCANRLLLSLILIAGLITACQSHPTNVPIGMTVHYRGADAQSIDEQFDAMADMKVSWARIDVDWSVIEPAAGQHDWSSADLLIDAALARGIQVLAVLAFSPSWSTSRPGGNRARPDDVAAFTTFARTAAQRYAPRGVHHWEIWNEPNTETFWPPAPDVAEYSTLFRTTAEVIRRVDPKPVILIGGLSPFYDGTTSDIAPADYLERLYDSGAAQMADGIAMHPYTFPSRPMDSWQRTTGGFRDLPALHDLMARRGDGHKKIWVTEYGAPTGTGPNAVSERDQAAILVHAREEVSSWDWTGPLIYYELVDGGTDASEIEENFGVLRADNSRKLAALTLADTAG